MEEEKKIIGCFVMTSVESSFNEEIKNLIFKKGKEFRTYIWGETGIDKLFENLSFNKYGYDLNLILFKFSVFPTQSMVEVLTEFEKYNKREKSVSFTVVIDDENFFNKSHEERKSFLKIIFIQKIALLKQLVKKNKLDTNLDLLISDLEKILDFKI